MSREIQEMAWLLPLRHQNPTVRDPNSLVVVVVVGSGNPSKLLYSLPSVVTLHPAETCLTAPHEMVPSRKETNKQTNKAWCR